MSGSPARALLKVQSSPLSTTLRTLWKGAISFHKYHIIVTGIFSPINKQIMRLVHIQSWQSSHLLYLKQQLYLRVDLYMLSCNSLDMLWRIVPWDNINIFYNINEHGSKVNILPSVCLMNGFWNKTQKPFTLRKLNFVHVLVMTRRCQKNKSIHIFLNLLFKFSQTVVAKWKYLWT